MHKCVSKKPSLVQIMACRLVSAKPLSELMLDIVHWKLRNKLQWNLNCNLYIFIQENAFENVIWKMAASLSRPQCVKAYGCSIHLHMLLYFTPLSNSKIQPSTNIIPNYHICFYFPFYSATTTLQDLNAPAAHYLSDIIVSQWLCFQLLTTEQ